MLFTGSGPYRVSQETRGNLFAHSIISYLDEAGIDYVVMDNDAAGTLLSDVPAGRYLSRPFDREALLEVIASEKPTHIWPISAGKEMQALVLRVLAETPGVTVPGGTDAYEAAVSWTHFRELADSLGVKVPFGTVAATIEDAAAVASQVGFPVFLSASQSRGGGGARIAYNYEELAAHAGRLLSWSLSGEVLVVRVYEKHPQCEVHVLRDSFGKVKVLGIVDALAPLGVHIGNTAEVFPAASLAPKRAAEVTGAAAALAGRANLVGYGVFHFGLDPAGSAYAVGMRVGFTTSSYIVALGLDLDIARAATALAFGQSIRSAVKPRRSETRVAISAPHFDNHLFPGSTDALGSFKMSTGMATGVAEHFAGAFLAAERSSMDDGGGIMRAAFDMARERDVLPALAAPRVGFLTYALAAIVRGHTFEEISAASGIDRVYIEELAGLVRVYGQLKRAAKAGGAARTKAVAAAREAGLSISEIEAVTPAAPKAARRAAPRRVRRRGKGVFVVVGPPARDVGCIDESDVILRGLCKAYAARGHKLVLVGWRGRQPLDLYFMADEVHWGDPSDALGDVLLSKSAAGVYVDPRNADWENLSRQAVTAGAPLVSGDVDLVAALADRKSMAGVLPRAGLLQKEGEEASGLESARRAAAIYGYPVLVRRKGTAHSFVVAYDDEQLAEFVSDEPGTVVVERFLEDLVETAVVVLADGKAARTIAVIEVLEEPGISSIDRAGVLPPFSISDKARELLSSRGEALVSALGARGLVTLRLGIRYDVPYFLSATVGASREVPFSALALGRDVVAAAAEVLSGATVAEAWPESAPRAGQFFVRQPVFSFGRFPGADTVLGTLPRSTGDVVGVGPNFALAYADARRASGRMLPTGGTVFLSLRDRDKRSGILISRQLKDLGFKIVATEGTARALSSAGIDARVVYRVSEGRPNVVDLLKNREITLVIYTPSGRAPREDEVQIRTVAWGLGILVITTVGEALAVVGAIEALEKP